jgi:hypothetical protein
VPDLINGNLGGLRDRFHHEPLDRPLAQFAQHCAQQEVLLVSGSTRQELVEHERAIHHRAGSSRAYDAIQGCVDLGEGQHSGRRRRLRHRGAQRCRADPDATLAGLAR